MDIPGRLELTLSGVLDRAAGARCPPRLAAAVRHAVFPGGARIRPRLCLAVAMACGADAQSLPVAEAAAVSIELFHCASLVHDDMPCFDDAALRRGRPSVHVAFGEELALLAGDALIVLAFEALLLPASAPGSERLAGLMRILCRAAGMPAGIVAGQAWESEPNPSLAEYHRAKTGILFSAATESGALAVGADPFAWTALGERLGEAYQVADDIRDAAANPADLGKPVGRDAALGRPSAARTLGLRGALLRFNHLLEGAVASVPDCPGADVLRAMIEAESRRLIPDEIARQAA
jgi:geranylgeranyl diphosphate synthase type II